MASDRRTDRDIPGAAVPKDPRRQVPPHFLRWAALAAAFTVAIGLLLWNTQKRLFTPTEVASLHDGASVITLTDAGVLSGISGLDPEEHSWVVQALRGGRLPFPPGTVGRGTASVLRGSGKESGFRLLDPADARVFSDRPTFRWQKMEGATGYQVTVFTPEEKVVAQSKRLTGTEWQPDAPFAREQKLAWQVTAYRGREPFTEPAPPAPSAVFEAIPAAAAARIEAARSSPSPSHLLLAALYASEGWSREASLELTLLRQQNPGSAVVLQLEKNLPTR